jgi:hypothetical protein
MADNYSDPYIAVTPLYAFSSDSEELTIGELFRLIKYQPNSLSTLGANDILLKHLRIREPDYLLWQRAPVEGAVLRDRRGTKVSGKGGGDLDQTFA